ncbi:MAG: hypothetical protein HFE84_00965 [Lachnospiraceae bacterium]|nr:hypothetical protein [Lachnospiraceae bacterium]
MEQLKEQDARFIVHHEVTEDKLVHLDKGLRMIGFLSRGRQIVTALCLLSVLTFILAYFADGVLRVVSAAVGLLSFLLAACCLYSFFREGHYAKKEIKRQFANRAGKERACWEYRFYDQCYEVVGRHELSHVKYSYIGRVLNLSGMLVLVEKGNVVRYFMQKDLTKGDGEGLRRFLEEKCQRPVETVRI